MLKKSIYLLTTLYVLGFSARMIAAAAPAAKKSAPPQEAPPNNFELKVTFSIPEGYDYVTDPLHLPTEELNAILDKLSPFNGIVILQRFIFGISEIGVIGDRVSSLQSYIHQDTGNFFGDGLLLGTGSAMGPNPIFCLYAAPGSKILLSIENVVALLKHKRSPQTIEPPSAPVERLKGVDKIIGLKLEGP
jgi:hypothetical protein